MAGIAGIGKVSAKGGFKLFLGETLSKIISAVGTMLVARLLGPSEFGIISVVFTFPLTVMTFRDLGVNTAITRFVAKYRSEDKPEEIKNVLEAGIIVDLVLSAMLSFGVFFSAGFIASDLLGRPSIKCLIEIASFSIFGWALVTLSESCMVDLPPGTYDLHAYYGDVPSLILVINATASIAEGETDVKKFEFPLMKGILDIQYFSGTIPIPTSVEITDEENTTFTYQSPCKVILMPGSYILEANYAFQTNINNVTVPEGGIITVHYRFKGMISFLLNDIVRVSLVILGTACGIVIALGLFRVYQTRRRYKEQDINPQVRSN